MKDYYLYEEVVNIVSSHLMKIDNLSKFCVLNKLNYQVVLQIKNKRYKKQFPKIVLKLSNLFNYNFELKKTIFIVKK